MISILILLKQNFMYAVKGNFIYFKILIPQFFLHCEFKNLGVLFKVQGVQSVISGV